MVFKLLIISIFTFFPRFHKGEMQDFGSSPPLGDGGKPNVVLIYADDLGFAETEPYGQQKIRTPNIARLAAEGMRFTDHYSGSPVCAPARCMLLTGKHAGHAHIRNNHGLGGFADSEEAGQMPLPEGTFTIGHLFQRAGYRTAAIGKWGLGMHDNSGDPNRQGFDCFFGYLDQKQAHNHYPSHLWENGKRVALGNPEKFVHRRLNPETAREEDFDFFKGSDYAPEQMTEKALLFMEEHRNEPFFLYLPYTLPHVSLQIPDEHVAEYRDEFGDRPYHGQNGYAAHRYPRAAYAAMISFLDAQVGRILRHLKALGLDENTIVLFSSDNGTTFNGGVDHVFFNSTGGLRGLKADLFEGGIRVPFIARWPGRIPPSSVSNHVSAQYDLMATFAELLGATVPGTDGISLLPTLLQRGAQREHDFLYFEFPEKGGQLAVRIGRWKGVKRHLKNRPDAPWMLFDLDQDPSESHDIASDRPDILRRLDGAVESLGIWRFENDLHSRRSSPFGGFHFQIPKSVIPKFWLSLRYALPEHPRGGTEEQDSPGLFFRLRLHEDHRKGGLLRSPNPPKGNHNGKPLPSFGGIHRAVTALGGGKSDQARHRCDVRPAYFNNRVLLKTRYFSCEKKLLNFFSIICLLFL